MTPAQAAVIRAWTRAQIRCRQAYYLDRPHEQVLLARAKSVRKAAAQKRYRDRLEAERRALARSLTTQEGGR